MYETKTDLSDAFTAGLSEQPNLEVCPHPLAAMEIPANGISFYVIRIARAIIVPSNDNFFIGRSAVEDTTKPMLNLENLDGLGMSSSVSRRHALICPVENGYEIVDLFSKNGTWIGGLRLLPNKSYPINSGDMLKFGQERVLIHFHSPQSQFDKQANLSAEKKNS
jgi:pSer/pThr/pTyr-binding forkhead associated (FHA) protein